MRPELSRLLVRSVFVLAFTPGLASAAPSWVPAVRLVAWSAVQRFDGRAWAGDGERRVVPLDRGAALHLHWSLGADAPLERPRDGCPWDAQRWDIAPDPDRIWRAPPPTADEVIGQPPAPIDEGCAAVPARPSAAFDPRRVSRAAAAVRSAMAAVERAEGRRAQALAGLGLQEARARLELAEGASAMEVR